MTLVEAIAVIGLLRPIPREPAQAASAHEHNARVNEAARVLDHALRGLARVPSSDVSAMQAAAGDPFESTRESAVVTVLDALARRGPRDPIPAHVEDKDVYARAYLRRCLRNAVVTNYREGIVFGPERTERWTSAGDPVDGDLATELRRLGDPTPEDLVERADILHRFFSVVVSTCVRAVRSDARERTEQSIWEMVLIHSIGLTFETLIDAETGSGPVGDQERERARDLIQKHHERARGRLLRTIAHLEGDGTFGPLDADALRGLVEAFKSVEAAQDDPTEADGEA